MTVSRRTCRDAAADCAAAQTSYLLYASDNNQNFKIARLDANYYNVTSVVTVRSVFFFQCSGAL